MMLDTSIASFFAGAVEHLWLGKPSSAIGKRPVAGRVEICANGLACDAQTDLTEHGGADKASHHYPAEHYPSWRKELARSDLSPGSFRENFATFGLIEDTVCIGDIFTLGKATAQISQHSRRVQ
jgi:MOSC domain-containing protein YiiM